MGSGDADDGEVRRLFTGDQFNWELMDEVRLAKTPNRTCEGIRESLTRPPLAVFVFQFVSSTLPREQSHRDERKTTQTRALSSAFPYTHTDTHHISK